MGFGLMMFIRYGFLNGFSQVQTSMFAVEFDEPDDDFQTAGVGDEDNPNPDEVDDNDQLAQFKLEGLSIKDWLTENGGNVFAEVAEGGADASSEETRRWCCWRSATSLLSRRSTQ